MTINFDSVYKKHANLELDWLPMDTKERYEKNLVNNYEELEKNGWINNKFTYKFNSLGFRCDEFTNDPTIMFLGCSYTCGIGLPLEKIWPELVAKHFNMRCANLGVGGGAADTAFRYCLGYIDTIKPKIVVYLKPEGTRLELSINDEITPINVYSYKGNDYNVLIRQFFKMWLVGEENNSYFNNEKNSLAMRYICTSRNILFLELDSKKMLRLDLARDLGHDGVKSHSNFSKYVIEEIEKLVDPLGLEPRTF
jgi:hypothetical protein